MAKKRRPPSRSTTAARKGASPPAQATPRPQTIPQPKEVAWPQTRTAQHLPQAGPQPQDEDRKPRTLTLPVATVLGSAVLGVVGFVGTIFTGLTYFEVSKLEHQERVSGLEKAVLDLKQSRVEDQRQLLHVKAESTAMHHRLTALEQEHSSLGGKHQVNVMVENRAEPTAQHADSHVDLAPEVHADIQTVAYVVDAQPPPERSTVVRCDRRLVAAIGAERAYWVDARAACVGSLGTAGLPSTPVQADAAGRFHWMVEENSTSNQGGSLLLTIRRVECFCDTIEVQLPIEEEMPWDHDGQVLASIM